MYTNEATLIGFIYPPQDIKPTILEFEGKQIASLETVIETGKLPELYIPIHLTGENIEVARGWFQAYPQGFHARIQSTLIVFDGRVHAIVNFLQAREERKWQAFE